MKFTDFKHEYGLYRMHDTLLKSYKTEILNRSFLVTKNTCFTLKNITLL